MHTIQCNCTPQPSESPQPGLSGYKVHLTACSEPHSEAPRARRHSLCPGCLLPNLSASNPQHSSTLPGKEAASAHEQYWSVKARNVSVEPVITAPFAFSLGSAGELRSYTDPCVLTETTKHMMHLPLLNTMSLLRKEHWQCTGFAALCFLSKSPCNGIPSPEPISPCWSPLHLPRAQLQSVL